MIEALLAELWPWLAGFYVLDAIAQTWRGHLLLAGAGRLRARGPGLHVVGLNPADVVVAAHDLPFLPSERAAWFFPPRRRTDPPVVEPADLEPVPWAELTAATRHGRRVEAGGRLLVLAPTAEWAERIRDELAELAAAPEGRRLDAFEARAREAGDVAAARARWARLRRWVVALQLTAVALAAATAAAAALPSSPRVPLAWVVAGLWVAEGVLAAGLLRAGAASWGRSLRGAAALWLWPVAALHPLVHVGKGAWERFAALTLCAAILDRAAFLALAGRELRRAELSRARTPELARAWDVRERGIEALVAAVGATRAAVLAPPAVEAGAAAFCPLCASQYRAGFARCAECGVELLPFPTGARVPDTAGA